MDYHSTMVRTPPQYQLPTYMLYMSGKVELQPPTDRASRDLQAPSSVLNRTIRVVVRNTLMDACLS
jgi:hypothetical protein